MKTFYYRYKTDDGKFEFGSIDLPDDVDWAIGNDNGQRIYERDILHDSRGDWTATLSLRWEHTRVPVLDRERLAGKDYWIEQRK